MLQFEQCRCWTEYCFGANGEEEFLAFSYCIIGSYWLRTPHANLPVSLVSPVAVKPFLDFAMSNAFILAALVSASGAFTVGSGVFVVVSSLAVLFTLLLPPSPPITNCLRFLYSFIDSFRFGVAGGRSLGGLSRGSALCVRVSTFGVIAFDIAVDGVVNGDGIADTGVVGSLNVEYDFVK